MGADAADAAKSLTIVVTQISHVSLLCALEFFKSKGPSSAKISQLYGPVMAVAAQFNAEYPWQRD